MPIRNGYVLAVAAAYVPAALIAGVSVSTIGWSLLAGLLVAILSAVVLGRIFGFGGGVCKMLGGCYPWLGFSESLLTFCVITFGLAGLAGIGMMVMKRQGESIPMLPFIVIGFALTAPFGELGQQRTDVALVIGALAKVHQIGVEPVFLEREPFERVLVLAQQQRQRQ